MRKLKEWQEKKLLKLMGYNITQPLICEQCKKQITLVEIGEKGFMGLSKQKSTGTIYTDENKNKHLLCSTCLTKTKYVKWKHPNKTLKTT